MSHSEIKELILAKQLIEEGKIKEASQIVLELEQRVDLTPQELLSCKLLKADLLRRLGNYLDAIKIAEDIFQECQKQGDLLSSIDALIIQAFAYMMMVNISKSEVITKQVEDLFKIIKETISIDLRARESFLVRIKAAIHYFKGELQLSLELNKKAYELAKDTGNKALIVTSLNNIADKYHHMEEYDQAIKYAKKAIKVKYEPSVIYALATLIETYISKGDIKEAKVYLDQLRYHSEKLDIKRYKSIYYISKATILKSSLRARDRIKSEDLFKELATDNTVLSELRIIAIINLCDLYLTELQITNDPEIINEIHPYIQELLNIAEDQHLYLYLAEAYILQAKLSLLTLDIKKAKRFFTQAQKIADSYDMKRLAMKISYEHDELLKQLEMWEILKESNASLAERMELSGLNKQMERMLRKGLVSLPKLEAEQPVLLTIMSKEGNIILSNPFTADITIDSTYFGEFLASCNTFCDQIFSETFDRVKFGQNTVLITTIDSFSICYMFQGQSYSARQKLIHFSEAIRKDSEIMKTLKDAKNKNIEIKISETASFEDLIYKSFLSDPKQFQMPFKAYEGDGPFVFVSYSHSDRLQVYPIIDYLNKTGRNIWYDEGIPVSEDWKKSIAENLERCSAFLVFITPHIIDSEYVRKEISFALKKKKSFFSVYLRETELPIELEFEMGNIQFMKKYLIPESEFYTKLNRMLDPVLK